MEVSKLQLPSIEEIERRLGKLIAERVELAKKDSTEPASKTWYSARQRILDVEIHKLRNQLFIARNSVL